MPLKIFLLKMINSYLFTNSNLTDYINYVCKIFHGINNSFCRHLFSFLNTFKLFAIYFFLKQKSALIKKSSTPQGAKHVSFDMDQNEGKLLFQIFVS